MSSISNSQVELANHLKRLEEKFEILKENSMKDKLCSFCKRPTECPHRLECKHRICRNCITSTIISELNKSQKLSVKCWKCNQISTNVIVELTCGCSEELSAKRSSIVEDTQGDIYVYNSILLDYSRPICRNHHQMTDEDLLLFFDEGTLREQLDIIAENKRKDEMTSLRGEIAGLVKETQVDLSGKLIGDEEARYIADYIKINPKLKILDLNTNEIKDEGMVVIAEALRNHNAIVRLDLRGNKFTEMGKSYMEDVNKDKGRQIRIMYFFITFYLVGAPGKK